MSDAKPATPSGPLARHRVLTASLALLAFLCLAPRQAGAFSYGVNLIQNGNAETGGSSANGSPVLVPNWTTSAFFTVIPYTAGGGYPTGSDPGPPDRGN